MYFRVQCWGISVALLLLAAGNCAADGPSLILGDKPSFGLFQPRVSAEIFSGGTSLGPTASSFLLDTGASGVLIYPPATGQLGENGFQNVGTYEEAGLSGTSLFDLSDPYRLNFTGTESTETISDVRFLSGASPPDPTGLMGLNGIVGMPALDGRVTSMDNRTREGALPLSMGVKFSDTLPATNTHRFTVPVKELAFPAEGDGALPTFESLSTLDIVSENAGNLTTDAIVLDSGAQVTIISEAIANRLGLDANGDGDFLDDAISTVPLSGATGTINAPVLMIDQMRIPTDQGFELAWNNAEVIVLDIHPRIQGVLGADFMSGDGGLDFSFLGGGAGSLLGGLFDDFEIGDALGDALGDSLGAGFGEILGPLFSNLLSGFDLTTVGDLEGFDLTALETIDLSLLESFGIPSSELDLASILGGGGGGADLFASFPLESYFDQVHFDFREFPESGGQLVFDLNPAVSAQILNGDHVFDVADIDDLTSEIDGNDLSYDLNDDGFVQMDDRVMLIQDVFRTVAGDTDLDQDVDFADFLALSGAFGKNNAGWGDGDFDGNGSVEFGDFLSLSANFGVTPSPASSVPEPSANLLAIVAAILLLVVRRHPR